MDSLFLSFTNEHSGRTAIVDEHEGSIWLYVTEPQSQQIAMDCWLINTAHDDNQPDLEHFRDLGVPPPAKSDFTDANPVVEDAGSHQWEISWNRAGNAVAAILDGTPLGLIDTRTQLVCALHLVLDGPWGAAWDQTKYDEAFDPEG